MSSFRVGLQVFVRRSQNISFDQTFVFLQSFEFVFSPVSCNLFAEYPEYIEADRCTKKYAQEPSNTYLKEPCNMYLKVAGITKNFDNGSC